MKKEEFYDLEDGTPSQKIERVRVISIDILKFLNEENIPVQEKTGFIVFKKCPFCNGSQKSTVAYKHPKYKDGTFRCLSCKGNSFAEVYSKIKNVPMNQALRDIYQTIDKVVTAEDSLLSSDNIKGIIERLGTVENNTSDDFSFLEDLKSLEFYPFNKIDLEDEKYSPHIDYLRGRGFSDEDIDKSEASVLASNLKEYLMDIMRINRLNKDEVIDLIDFINNYSKYFENQKNKHNIAEVKRTVNEIEERFEKKEALTMAKTFCLFRNRVVFPVKILGKIVGYIGRDITGKQKQFKVLNSSGFSSSKFLWNLDNVMDAEYHVISEGIFSANSCGINNSVAILGKNVSSDGELLDKFKLLSLGKAKKVYIYLDVGTKKETFELAEGLSMVYEEVRVVIPPTIFKISENLTMWAMELCGVYPDLYKDKHIYLSFLESRILKEAIKMSKMSLSQKNSRYSQLKKEYSLAIARRIVSLVEKMSNNRDIHRTVEILSEGSFLDSNDLSKEENEKLINKARLFEESDPLLIGLETKICKLDNRRS